MHPRPRFPIVTTLSPILFLSNLHLHPLQVCWSIKLYSSEPWALITARAIVGFGVSGSYVVTPLYIKEISEDTIRGTLGSLVILSQNFGNLLVYIMGEYLSYHAVLWICLAVPLVHLMVFLTMPDSPSYLLKCGKVEVSCVLFGCFVKIFAYLISR